MEVILKLQLKAFHKKPPTSQKNVVHFKLKVKTSCRRLKEERRCSQSEDSQDSHCQEPRSKSTGVDFAKKGCSKEKCQDLNIVNCPW